MTPLRLAFAGTPDFAARHLAVLLDGPHELSAVLTQPDRPAGRGKQPRPGPVKVLAEAHGLDVLQPPTLRDQAAQEALRQLNLDALIVVAYGLILPAEALLIPRYGCLNVHGSLLPRWRGAAPIQRAIEAGDRESGVTIMQMDEGLDTGPMLARARCTIDPLMTSGDLYNRLAELGPTSLLEVLADLPGCIAAAQRQVDGQATYAAKIDKAESQLDWRRDAALLARRVRAFNPAPGCFSPLGEHRIKVWEAQPAPSCAASPGEIVSADDTGIRVACADGSLLLTRLQLPGARAMAVDDILRGRSDLFTRGQHFAIPAAP